MELVPTTSLLRLRRGEEVLLDLGRGWLYSSDSLEEEMEEGDRDTFNGRLVITCSNETWSLLCKSVTREREGWTEDATRFLTPLNEPPRAEEAAFRRALIHFVPRRRSCEGEGR